MSVQEDSFPSYQGRGLGVMKRWMASPVDTRYSGLGGVEEGKHIWRREAINSSQTQISLDCSSRVSPFAWASSCWSTSASSWTFWGAPWRACLGGRGWQGRLREGGAGAGLGLPARGARRNTDPSPQRTAQRRSAHQQTAPAQILERAKNLKKHKK